MWLISDVEKKSNPICLHICNNIGSVSEVSKKISKIIGFQWKCSHKGITLSPLRLLFERLCFSPLFTPSAIVSRSLSVSSRPEIMLMRFVLGRITEGKQFYIFMRRIFMRTDKISTKLVQIMYRCF